MSKKFMGYIADDGVSYAVAVEGDIYGVYTDLTGIVTPQLFNSLAELQVVAPGWNLTPKGMTCRTITVKIPGFTGDLKMVCREKEALQGALVISGIHGDTPFPAVPVTESHLGVQVTGYAGESRNSN